MKAQRIQRSHSEKKASLYVTVLRASPGPDSVINTLDDTPLRQPFTVSQFFSSYILHTYLFFLFFPQPVTF